MRICFESFGYNLIFCTLLPLRKDNWKFLRKCFLRNSLFVQWSNCPLHRTDVCINMKSYRQNHVEVVRLSYETEFSCRNLYLVQNCTHLSSSLGVLENIPILVQWKWQERTKTFLVIFHLYDDYSEKNVRFRRLSYRNKEYVFDRPTITWSPSHPETARVSEILSYANIINGFKEKEKRELRSDLEVAVDMGKQGSLFWEPLKTLLNMLPNKVVLFEAKDRVIFLSSSIIKRYKKKFEKDFFLCIELCPEYIIYLRKILEPYLKD